MLFLIFGVGSLLALILLAALFYLNVWVGATGLIIFVIVSVKYFKKLTRTGNRSQATEKEAFNLNLSQSYGHKMTQEINDALNSIFEGNTEKEYHFILEINRGFRQSQEKGKQNLQSAFTSLIFESRPPLRQKLQAIASEIIRKK